MLDTIAQLRASKEARTLPIELVQLDDGWQSQWGDWLTPHSQRFPRGLQPITAAAKAAGMMAGLWIAPVALSSSSRLLREHPEWILRSASGAPLKCGFTAPGLWIYALDVTHPDAVAYIRTVVGTATREWGFDYLKLDFLHTAAMPGAARHDPSVGRAAALHHLMASIRAEVGEDVFVLACGAPLGPCIGHVDGMRVSADAATHWLPRLLDVPGLRWVGASDRTNLPAARNMVRNVAARLPMGCRLWRNDPDCLIMRDAGADFSTAQAAALATVAALSAGALIFSDPPSALTAERLALLQALLPPLPRPAVPVDLLLAPIPSLMVAPLSASDSVGGSGGSPIGSWWLLGAFNWGAAQASAGGGGGIDVRVVVAAAAAAVDSGEGGGEGDDDDDDEGSLGWHAFEFWTRTYHRLPPDAPPVLPPADVAPRCGCLYALRRLHDHGGAQLVGTNVHISCGLEVALWREEEVASSIRIIELRLRMPCAAAAAAPAVWLYLPGTTERCAPSVAAVGAAEAGSTASPPQWVSDGVWRIELTPARGDGLTDVHRIMCGTADDEQGEGVASSMRGGSGGKRARQSPKRSR